LALAIRVAAMELESTMISRDDSFTIAEKHVIRLVLGNTKAQALVSVCKLELVLDSVRLKYC